MSSNPTKTWQAYQASDVSIKLPTQQQFCPFTPNAISVNNRSAINVSVGPTPQGPFLNIGLYTQATLPWTYGPSFYIKQLGTGTIQAGDFIEVDFLAVNPANLGAGTVASYPLQVWNVQAPGGISTSQPVTISGNTTLTGLLQFLSNPFEFDIGIDGSGNLQLFTRPFFFTPVWQIPDGAQSMQFSSKVYPGTPATAFQTAAGLYAGTGAPNNAQGSNGDFYFRSDGGASTTIYQRRSGSWVGIV